MDQGIVVALGVFAGWVVLMADHAVDPSREPRPAAAVVPTGSPASISLVLNRDSAEPQREKAELQEEFYGSADRSAPRSAERGLRRQKRQQEDATTFVTRLFPVADLIAGPPSGGPAFEDHAALIRLIKRTVGARRWKGVGEIEWLARRQLLQVRHEPAVVDEVGDLLKTLRHPGSERLEVTVRLMVVPVGTSAVPAVGEAMIASAAEVRRLWKAREKSASNDRTHRAHYSLADRDVVYAWTAHGQSPEASHRGLNVVVQTSSDRRGANVTAYPLAGDESKVDWPELFVGVGQSAVYAVPVAETAPGDQARVLVLLTLDAFQPGDDDQPAKRE